jgi:hypothetical protein
MNRIYLFIVFVFCISALFAQESGAESNTESSTVGNKESNTASNAVENPGNSSERGPMQFQYSGQLSAWGQYTPDISTKSWLDGRYIPQINYEIPLLNNRLIDFEASANIFGDMGIQSLSNISTEGKIKPYRA